MENYILPVEGIFWQSEAEGCAIEKSLSVGRLRKYYRRNSQVFSSLYIKMFPSITAPSTWEPLVNISLLAQLTSHYTRRNIFRICWIWSHGKYYLCLNAHLCLLIYFRQQTTLFKATKETVENSSRCSLVPDSIILILFEVPQIPVTR